MRRLLKTIARRILDKPEYSVNINVSTIADENLLRETNALITGGSRGIGKEIAIRIVECGGRCVVLGRKEDALEDLCKHFSSMSYISYDMKKVEGYHDLLRKAAEKVGGNINALILNAGVSNHESSISKVSVESFQEQFDTNLRANYFILSEYAKIIENSPGENRNILVMSSETGSMPYDVPYGLTKAALNRLIEGFSHRYYKSGCRVNGIAPGEVFTDMAKSSGITVDNEYGYARKNCMGRLMVPREIAEVAIFLLSNRSSCISGEVIHCNANNHMRSYLD